VRGRRSLLPGLLAGLLTLLGILIAIPVTVVSGYLPAAVTGHRLVWIALLAVGATAIAALTWLASRAAASKPGRWPSLVPAVPGWVDRGELAEVVSALTAAGSGAVALTTGLVGAGGFGKTTLAAKACQDRKVRRLFRGGIVWITVGRDTGGPGLAARISEVIATADGGSGPAFTGPEQAGQALARALSGGGRTLLVVDDVWTAAQLQPFLAAGEPVRLLVTTRRPAVLENVADPRQIKVDAMPDAVARRLLTRGLPVMAAGLERDLLDLTGRWPLLLNLVNHRLAGDVDRGAHIDTAAAAAAGRLRERGPAALDITDSGQRQTAVAATELHQLRHSAATHLGEQGVPLQLIMAKTRHRNPRTAMCYVRPGTEAVAEATAQPCSNPRAADG
jgi:NB-ARC domain/Phage integrase family